MTVRVLGVEMEGANRPPAGANAHVEGLTNLAPGAQGHAEGTSTQATGAASHSEGASSVASGNSAHAEGNSTFATGNYSHAEGYNTSASGYCHAEGQSTSATGSSAHSEGSSTLAQGTNSHAEGSLTTASGVDSHAEGLGSKATGQSTHGGGQFATADAWSSWARGSMSSLATVGASRAQAGIYTMGFKTTNTIQMPLTFDGLSTIVSTTPNQNVYLCPATFSAVMFDVLIVARALGAAQSVQGWQIIGAACNDANGLTFIGTPTVTSWQGTVAVGSVTMKTYSTNAIAVYVTSSLAASVAWHAVMRTSELVTTS